MILPPGNATGRVSTAGTSACAAEPIHIPGAIQPHGCLLVAGADGLICQASSNARDFLGLSLPPVGQPLHHLLGPVVDRITEHQDKGGGSLAFTIGDRRLWLTHHTSGLLRLVEIEEAGTSTEPQDVETALRKLTTRTHPIEMLQSTAEAVRSLTGFDRVVVYQFDEDEHGWVVAESRELAMEPYLGLHFPESDIPRQARALYLRNWIRSIPDASYQQVPIQPTLRPDNKQPLDLSDVSLRSVSPVHLQYMQNMGVRASMSISLIGEGRLWGLISCGHRTPMQVPPSLRFACETIGRLVSLQLAAFAATDFQTRMQASRPQMDTLRASLVQGDGEVLARLLASPLALTSLMGASGAAVVYSENVRRHGLCPSDETLLRLAAATADVAEEGVFATRELGAKFPEFAEQAATASGVLAVHIPGDASCLLWVRPEIVQTPTGAAIRSNPQRWGQTVLLLPSSTRGTHLPLGGRWFEDSHSPGLLRSFSWRLTCVDVLWNLISRDGWRFRLRRSGHERT